MNMWCNSVNSLFCCRTWPFTVHVFDRFIYIVCGTTVVFTVQFRKVRQIVITRTLPYSLA